MRCATFALFAALTACGGDPDLPQPPSGITPLASNQLVFDATRASTNHEIFVMRTDGSGITQLTRDAHYENWWARISPDRKKVLFYRAPLGQSENYAQASLWVMNADGSGLTQLRAKNENSWSMQGHAEWSPNGTQIAMFGSVGSGASASLEIFVTDATGKNPVQYTNRGGVNTDVSWSPNGQQLLFNGCPNPAARCQPVDYEIYLMNAVPLSAATRITNDSLADYDPYFSPDGSQIAWLVNVDPGANVVPGTSTAMGRWAIRIATIGSTARYLIDDGHINSKPAWSLDGQSIYFHRMAPTQEWAWGLFRIDPNGMGLTRLTAMGTGHNEHPSN